MGTENDELTSETDIEPASADVDPAPEPEQGASANDDEGGRQPEAAPRQTRKDKRAARVDVEAARAETAELRRVLEGERNERQRIDRELSELRANAQAGNERTADEKFRHKLTSLRNKANQHLAVAAQNEKNPQLAQREMDAYYDTLDEIQDARLEHRDSNRPKPGPQGPDAAAIAMWSALSAEHDWLNDETHAAARVTAGHYAAALISQGKPDNLGTYRLACSMAARDFKLGGRQAPSAGQRARYGGVSSREGDGSGDGRETVRMGKHEEAMAEASYPQLEPREAHRAWARDIGRHVNGANQ